MQFSGGASSREGNQSVLTCTFSEENRRLLDPSGKYAVVMGNEVKGVQQEAIDHCDGCIEIPQYGTKHSLNVSVTAGIVIWDLFKKLTF